MNRYIQDTDYQIITEEHDQFEEKFESCEYSLDYLENQQQNDHHHLPSVKKYLSQPNPLMNKIQFTSYFPKWYFPRQMGRLPKCLKDYSCCQSDKNNMNSILQSVNGHQKLKRNVLNALLNKKKDKNQVNNNLMSLEEYCSNKSLVYEKYSALEVKLEQNKFKLKYFATYVIDMARIFQRQMKQKIKNKDNNNVKENQNTVPARPVSKSGNFAIRQSKVNTQKLSSHDGVQKKQLSSSCSIQFDSNFQSGNLFKAYQKGYNQFDLILQNDINSKGNTQWFFFSIKGVPKNTTLKINIVNMSKPDSLFNIGMRPCIFSMMRYEKRNIGWVREGTNISYEESQILHKQSNKSTYYTLSFEYKFIYDGDIVYFSHSIPYTFTDLSSYLNKITTDKNLHKLIKIKNMGLTLGSNQIDLLEITNINFANKNKKIVWIIARQHPGETNSGFMLEGIIDYLTSSNQQARFLLNNFIFKIIPMVNVDGVIHGNSRAQFIGSDPNRKWAHPNKLHNPVIHSIKHYIQKDKNNIEMFLDLHAHSRKLGTFFYGNTTTNNTAATRIYPLMVCKKDARFTYKYCRFAGGSNSTARFSLFESLKIPLIYTVQSSFYGYQQGDHKIITYLPKDYKQMGHSLMINFAEYEIKRNGKFLKIEKAVEISENLEKQFESELKQNEDCDEQSVGSDEDPDGDEYNEKEFKKLVAIKIDKKKKKEKKKKQLQIKMKVVKEEQVTPVTKKPKQNNSQSYYKDYFSGRVSMLKKDSKLIPEKTLSELRPVKRQTLNIGIQVQMKERQSLPAENSTIFNKKDMNNGVLTERNQITVKLGSKQLPLPITVNSLCVIGQKVEEIQIYGNSVGIQVSENKQIFMNKAENQNSMTSNRKSFSVRTRTNSFLQVKQNNFLQRGDCMTKNFFSRK